MKSQEEEISHSRKGSKALFSIAFTAVFLLVGICVVLKILVGSSGQDTVKLSLDEHFYAGNTALSTQIRSDQAVAPEAPELVFLSKTSVVATVPPMGITPKVLGAIIGASSLDVRDSREILHYLVEESDTIESLAEKFAISINTIVWANDLDSGSQLTPGDELIILPVSGALHLVRPNDTLSEIASWYRGDVERILEFNELASAGDIFVGDFLVVPDGRKPAVLPSGRLTPLANSYFIYPVPRSWKITQGLHPFNALDISNGTNGTCGGPVYAAAGGIVQQAGYHSVAGNYVRVLHPNGVVTFYGHLSGQAVSPGERVLQGQIVGYVGYSGYTIPAGPAGCHLHFEVRGAANPFAK